MLKRIVKLFFIFAFFLASTKSTFATAWDVSTANYDNISQSVATALYDLTFKPDGTKMYVAGHFSDRYIYEYTLSTAWDLSTAYQTYKFDNSGYAPMSVDFNIDGTKMYAVEFYNDSVREYTLSTAWDLSSASYNSVSKSFSSQDGLTYAGTISANGEKYYTCGSSNKRVYQYSLTTPWDLSSWSYDSKSYYWWQNSNTYYCEDVTFKPDGSMMWLSIDDSGSGYEYLFQYSLSTAWDVSTASYNNVYLYVGDRDATNTGIYFTASGAKMFLGGRSNSKIFQYSLAPADVTDPVISNVAVTPSSTSADVTWTTDEEASSLVEYGPVSTYGLSTAESDTSTRVTDHSVTVSSLVACTRYYYRVKSSDASSNQAISDAGTFLASGCDSSSISGGSEEVVETTGGTVSYTNGNSTATITAPNNFTTLQTTIQINKLDSSSVPTAPSGKSLITDNFYDFQAIDSNGSKVSSFDTDVTFTLEYGSDAESAYQESSLDVYKYSGGTWVAKNCTVDTSANTLTCSLPSFSVYAVFGEAVAATTSDDSGSSSSAPSAEVCEDSKPSGVPNLFKIESDQNSATLYFSPVWQVSDYYVSYSTSDSAEEHGFLKSLNYDGVQVVKVDNLNSGTKYYFKVRGQNGCMPGDWSGIMSVYTRSAGSSFSASSLMNSLWKSDDDAKEMKIVSMAVEPTEEELGEVSDAEEASEIEEVAEEEVAGEGYELEVKVYHEGKPLVGAEIELHSTPRYATTDENGVAKFDNVEGGEHKVYIAYDGYAAEKELRVDGEDKAITVTMEVEMTKELIPTWAWIAIVSMVGVGVLVGVVRKR